MDMQLHTVFPRFPLAAFLVLVFVGPVAGQVLLEKEIPASKECEALLDLTASAPGTAWGEAGREAAVVSLYIDGRYHQDIMLYEGARAFTYSVMLGHFAPGSHQVRIEYNRTRSAQRASTVQIADAKISMVDSSGDEYVALAYAPILYARRNTIGRFTDAPVLSWYEATRGPSQTTIRYSMIFTNEDGGTQTNALMARWGRTTDIEYIYEAKIDSGGRIVSAIFQGANHKDLKFKGKREGGHPLFLVATDNNIFSDRGTSDVRYALRPIPFDLSRASREEVMFQHPWTYPLMVEELKRENKINEATRVGQQIADPGHYLYIQAGAKQQGTALSFAVKLKDDPKWYTSDLGIIYYKVDRSGYFQTTVRLPGGTTIDKVEKLAVRCDIGGDPRSWQDIGRVAKANCELTEVKRIFMLDTDYHPGPSLPPHPLPLNLQFGDMIELQIAGR